MGPFIRRQTNTSLNRCYPLTLFAAAEDKSFIYLKILEYRVCYALFVGLDYLINVFRDTNLSVMRNAKRAKLESYDCPFPRYLEASVVRGQAAGIAFIDSGIETTMLLRPAAYRDYCTWRIQVIALAWVEISDQSARDLQSSLPMFKELKINLPAPCASKCDVLSSD
ncbi:hypothetical protein NPIL_97681 [Nephila pilipes]|uniref:Uncharacterized protein n=1 Tax=Nephila pilipes TaxID=299642 RepID=A0A8X6QR91_NEPPI|nr:hypothetical protein NPIL_97681 [Nephila pilipes]